MRTWRVALAGLAAAVCLAYLTVPTLPFHHSASHIATRAVSSGAPAPLHPEAPLPPEVKPFFLSATVVRGRATIPALALPNNATEVLLQVEVRGVCDGNCDWSAEIDGTGSKVAEYRALEEKRAGPVRYVEVLVKPGTLVPGLYRVSLRGGPARVDTRREFRVIAGSREEDSGKP
jgi:hypothetical protein